MKEMKNEDKKPMHIKINPNLKRRFKTYCASIDDSICNNISDYMKRCCDEANIK